MTVIPKHDVFIEQSSTSPYYCYVWIDESLTEQLREIPGIGAVIHSTIHKDCFKVRLDPRYDPQEVIIEIESLGYSLPDAFKEFENKDH